MDVQQHLRDAVDNLYTFVQSLSSTESNLHSELVTKTASESIMLNIKEVAYKINLMKKQRIMNDFESLNQMVMSRKRRLNEYNAQCQVDFKECLDDLNKVSYQLSLANK